MPDQAAWQVLSAETVFHQPPWLSVIRQRVRLPSGLVIPDYLLAPGRDFSMVVAVTEAREVLLVRQYKHGSGRALTDFPAGYLESEHEDPLACAQRELLEETGHRAADWLALGGFLLNPNRSANRAHLFLARGLERVAEPSLDLTESLTYFTLPWRDVPSLLRPGQMDGLASAAAWGLARPYLL